MKKILQISTAIIISVYLLVPLGLTANAATKDSKLIMSPSSQTVRAGEEFQIDIMIENPSKQEILTAGFDISFPSNLLEVVDADKTKGGIQLDLSNSEFPILELGLNTVSNDSGTINFTAGAESASAITKDQFIVATIPFLVKNNVTTQIADIIFTASDNTDILGADENSNPVSLLSLDDGLNNAQVVISNVGLSLSPKYKEVENNEEFTVDIILQNPDKIDIVTIAFELGFDTDKLESKNTSDNILITVPDNQNLQIIENEIQSDGTIIFTGGFTGGTPFKDETLTIGNITFESIDEGTTNIRFNQSINSSSVYSLDDAASNYLAVFDHGTYIIGEGGDKIAPISSATPPGGIFSEQQSIKLESNDNDADIYYTLDGSTPTLNSTKYREAILLTQNSTLKFFAVDEAGNEERSNTETYRIGNGSFAIGITAVKTQINPGEKTSLIIKLIDSSINRSVPGKIVSLSNSGGGIVKAISGATTDDEGEILAAYTAPQVSGEDVITATLSDDTTVQGYLNIKIVSAEVATVSIFGSNLKTSGTNYISVTAEDNRGNRTTAQIPIELKVTKKYSSETKAYSANTVNGVATFGIQGSEFVSGSTYTFVASYNGVNSQSLELSTSGNSAPINRTRGGGGQPNTGPKENIMIIFGLSVVLNWFIFKKKQKDIVG